MSCTSIPSNASVNGALQEDPGARAAGVQESQRGDSPRDRQSDPSEQGLDPAGDGKMWLDPRFRSNLQALGLTRFDAVMASTWGHCMRVLPDRENWRLELPDAHDVPRGLFLKRHRVRSWKSRVRAFFGARPPQAAGRVEARAMRRLVSEGIAGAELVAFGEALQTDGSVESFLITEELAGYRPLDDFLRDRFAAPPCDRKTSRDLDRLVEQVATVARRLHEKGHNHRDLYCCHFFIREAPGGEFRIRLIDLQRVQHRHRFRRRWLVKDLAQLAYSAPLDRIGCRHRIRFLHEYLGVRKLGRAGKRLLRAVLAKQRRMERKEGRKA